MDGHNDGSTNTDTTDLLAPWCSSMSFLVDHISMQTFVSSTGAYIVWMSPPILLGNVTILSALPCMLAMLWLSRSWLMIQHWSSIILMSALLLIPRVMTSTWACILLPMVPLWIMGRVYRGVHCSRILPMNMTSSNALTKGLSMHMFDQTSDKMTSHNAFANLSVVISCIAFSGHNESLAYPNCSSFSTKESFTDAKWFTYPHYRWTALVWHASPGLTVTEDPLCEFDGEIYQSVDSLFSEAAANLDSELDDFYSIENNIFPSPAKDCMDFVEASVMLSLITELSVAVGFHLIHPLLVSPKVKLPLKECSNQVHNKTLDVVASTDVSLFPLFDCGPTLTLCASSDEHSIAALSVITSTNVSLLPFAHGLTMTLYVSLDECFIEILDIVASTGVDVLPFNQGSMMHLGLLLIVELSHALSLIGSTNVCLLPFDHGAKCQDSCLEVLPHHCMPRSSQADKAYKSPRKWQNNSGTHFLAWVARILHCSCINDRTSRPLPIGIWQDWQWLC